ncbi:MAG TPA: ATP-binding cassette domain-containing protein, partial [Limnochordia bacterium]
GPNGAGKSTLLKSLCGRLPLLGGELSIGAGVRFGYFSQDEGELDPGRSVLETLLEARHMPLGDARGYLARFLFRGEEVNKPLAALSGGERSRLRLACLLVQEANVLCLDEPTNHLDAPAREALEEALAAYPGTLIFISHDRYLLDRIAAKLWVVADGGVKVIDATYSAWRAAARAESARSSPPPPQTGRRGRSRRSPSPAAIAPTVADIEADIAKLEARRAELEQRLADPAQHQADPTGLRRAAASLETVVAELERLYALWEEAAERDLRA